MLQKYDTKYDYTPGGNISRKKQSAWGVGTEGNSITDVNLSYDNEYKYDSPKPHAVTKVGSTEYTYDLDGRMTGSYDSSSKFKRTFTWDEEGRLLKTVDNKHTTDYRYDANGERICKYSDLGETIYASGYYTETDGKKISKHIYIGSTRVASQVMSRTCETSTTMKRENTLYYHTDHLGSSGYVTDKKGEFYEHTEYTSSGESWVNEKVTGNANLPYKYCLKEMDNETGLYYYGARYYDARTSRWISTDPILESYLSGKPAGGVYNPVNMNLYAYCANSPVVLIDLDGNHNEHHAKLNDCFIDYGSGSNILQARVAVKIVNGKVMPANESANFGYKEDKKVSAMFLIRDADDKLYLITVNNVTQEADDAINPRRNIHYSKTEVLDDGTVTSNVVVSEGVATFNNNTNVVNGSENGTVDWNVVTGYSESGKDSGGSLTEKHPEFVQKWKHSENRNAESIKETYRGSMKFEKKYPNVKKDSSDSGIIYNQPGQPKGKNVR